MPNEKKGAQGTGLGLLLARVCRLVGGERRMKLESIGLHHAQGMILHRLWREDGVSQRVLAQDMHIAAPTVSSTLKRMERDGWVERRRDEEDQRIVCVYLTEKSKQLRHEALASFQEMDQELTALLTDKECEVLSRSLNKVYHYLASKTPVESHLPCGNQEQSTVRGRR